MCSAEFSVIHWYDMHPGNHAAVAAAHSWVSLGGEWLLRQNFRGVID